VQLLGIALITWQNLCVGLGATGAQQDDQGIGSGIILTIRDVGSISVQLTSVAPDLLPTDNALASQRRSSANPSRRSAWRTSAGSPPFRT
jgi:hypothetical protein